MCQRIYKNEAQIDSHTDLGDSKLKYRRQWNIATIICHLFRGFCIVLKECLNENQNKSWKCFLMGGFPGTDSPWTYTFLYQNYGYVFIENNLSSHHNLSVTLVRRNCIPIRGELNANSSPMWLPWDSVSRGAQGMCYDIESASSWGNAQGRSGRAPLGLLRDQPKAAGVHTAGRPLLPLCTDRMQQPVIPVHFSNQLPYCGQGPCSTNHHRFGGLKTMGMYSLADLEVKRLKSRCQDINDTWKYFPDI